MKKQVSKINLRTDKIVSLSKNAVQAIQGGGKPIAPTISGC